MKQKLLKSILLLCALVVGSSNIFAQATLPFEYDDGAPSSVTGFTHSGCGTYNASPKIKFDGNGDYATLRFAETPGDLTFTIKLNGNVNDNNEFTVCTSTDGTSYSVLKTYKGAEEIPASNKQYTIGQDEFPDGTRYIRWIYTNKASGNVGLGKITLAKAKTIAVSSIILNKSELSLAIGEEETLTATVEPANATNKNVTWESSNTDVAEVDADGKVTAKGTGVATITVTTEDGSKTATCTVTVMAARVDVTGVTLNKTATTLLIGSNETLTATVAPADATNKTVVWTSDDETIATVADGVVTAVGLGTATITATTEDGNFTATCEVTVNPIVVTGVTLDEATATLTVGETQTLVATFAPANATNKNVSWTSNNTAVASVSAEGVVTANAVGTATITVTTEDGSFTATCDITVNASSVKPSLTSVIFNETFAGCDGTGGRDGSFSGSIGTSSIVSDETWNDSPTSCGGASDCIKFGTSSKNGVIAATISLTGSATLTFSAAGWGADTNTLTVSATGATLSGDKSVTLTNSTWKDYIVNITEATGSVTITFTGKRGFLDGVKITQMLTAVDVTLSATGYASYCSPFALDLTPTEDYAAYAVTATSEESVTFSKIPGKVAANTPFILYNKDNAGQKVSLPVIEDDDAEIVAVSGNMLIGTLAPTYVTTVNGDYTNFGLSGGNFVKINDGTMKANKAYLPILTSNVPAGARLSIVFDEGETTGVREKVTVNSDKFATAPIYNLNGQRVSQPTRGLYIVNGRKVLVP